MNENTDVTTDQEDQAATAVEPAERPGLRVDPSTDEILFRKITKNLPYDACPPLPDKPWTGRWYVEYHMEWGAPVGLAFVSHCHGSPVLYYVLVADHMRRKGIATALIEACQSRWPDLWICDDALSDGGEALVRRYGDVVTTPEVTA